MPREIIPAFRKQPTNRERSQKQEKHLAKTLSGRTQPASGALAFFEGDVKTDTALVEGKTTKNKSFAVTHQLLMKITSEAVSMRRRPILALRFESIPAPTPQDWVLLPLSDYDALTGH
jgi:hypothetical protein